MSNSLKQIINLVQRTGDKCVILDEEQTPYVLMKLSDYEKIVNQQPIWEPVSRLTESELLDKINRDIAIWRDSREQDEGRVAVNMLEEELADDYSEDYPESIDEELLYDSVKSDKRLDEIPF